MVAEADIEMANKASSLQIPINIWQQRKKKEKRFTLLSLSSTYSNETHLSLGLHRSFVKKKKTNKQNKKENIIIAELAPQSFQVSLIWLGKRKLNHTMGRKEEKDFDGKVISGKTDCLINGGVRLKNTLCWIHSLSVSLFS